MQVSRTSLATSNCTPSSIMKRNLNDICHVTSVFIVRLAHLLRADVPPTLQLTPKALTKRAAPPSLPRSAQLRLIPPIRYHTYLRRYVAWRCFCLPTDATLIACSFALFIVHFYLPVPACNACLFHFVHNKGHSRSVVGIICCYIILVCLRSDCHCCRRAAIMAYQLCHENCKINRRRRCHRFLLTLSTVDRVAIFMSCHMKCSKSPQLLLLCMQRQRGVELVAVVIRAECVPQITTKNELDYICMKWVCGKVRDGLL